MPKSDEKFNMEDKKELDIPAIPLERKKRRWLRKRRTTAVIFNTDCLQKIRDLYLADQVDGLSGANDFNEDYSSWSTRVLESIWKQLKLNKEKLKICALWSSNSEDNQCDQDLPHEALFQCNRGCGDFFCEWGIKNHKCEDYQKEPKSPLSSQSQQ